MRISNISLKIIFPIIILLSILIPAIITNVIFYDLILDNNYKDNNEEIVVRAKGIDLSLDQYLESYEKILETISNHSTWKEMNEINSTLSQEEIADLYDDITTIPDDDFRNQYMSIIDLITIYELDSDILTIYYGTPQHNTYGNNPDNYIYTYGDPLDYDKFDGTSFDCVERPWYIGAVENEGSVYWSNPYQDRNDEQILIISASKAVYDDDQVLIGVISIDVYITEFIDKVFSLQIDDKYNSFIMNQAGVVIIGDTDEIGITTENEDLIDFIESSEIYYEDNDSNQVYTKYYNARTEWYTIQSYSKSVIASEMIGIINQVSIIGLFVLLLILILANFTSNFFLKPLNLVIEHVDKIDKGNLSIKINSDILKRGNEYGVLSRSITNMQSRMTEMITEVNGLNDSLLSAQELYSSLFNSPAVGNVLVSNNEILFINGTLTRLLEYSTYHDIVGKGFDFLFPKFQPNGKPSSYIIDEEMKQAYRNVTSEFDFYLQTKSGENIIAHLTCLPTQFKGENAVCIMFREADKTKIANTVNEKIVHLVNELYNSPSNASFIVEIGTHLQEFFSSTNYCIFEMLDNNKLQLIYSENVKDIESTKEDVYTMLKNSTIKVNKINLLKLETADYLLIPLSKDKSIQYVFIIEGNISAYDPYFVSIIEAYILYVVRFLKFIQSNKIS